MYPTHIKRTPICQDPIRDLSVAKADRPSRLRCLSTSPDLGDEQIRLSTSPDL